MIVGVIHIRMTKTGLDFIWRPNNSIQLTGTVRPDFGQVESDDLVVNFSAFETLCQRNGHFLQRTRIV